MYIFQACTIELVVCLHFVFQTVVEQIAAGVSTLCPSILGILNRFLSIWYDKLAKLDFHGQLAA